MNFFELGAVVVAVSSRWDHGGVLILIALPQILHEAGWPQVHGRRRLAGAAAALR